MKERETKGDRTRRYLYDCSVQLFREKGYDQVSVDEIVKKAGVAKGTFYIYFKKKSDIILEMLRQYDDYYDRIMSSLDDDLPVEKRLEEIVRGACRFTGDVIGLDLIRVLYIKQISSGDGQSRLLNEDRALFRILSGLVREGQQQGIYRAEYDAEQVTMLILRGIRSVFFEWCSSCGELNLTEECLWFLKVFRQGLCTGKAIF